MARNKLIGVYPGSFDPLTYGHLDIIKRALKIVDQLIVGIGVNPRKNKTFFSSEANVAIIERCLKEELSSQELAKIQVACFNGLLINFALEHNAKIIIRGLRALTDFDFEFNLACGNQALNPDIESIFLMTSVNKQFISSKLVTEIFTLKGDISQFVPPCIQKAILLTQQNSRDR